MTDERTTHERPPVWVADDDAERGRALAARLTACAQVQATGCTQSDALQRLADGERPAAIVLSTDDIDVPAVRQVVGAGPEVPLVVVAEGEGGDAILRAGAEEYLRRGRVDDDLLRQALRYAVDRRGARRALRQRTRLLGEIVDSMHECLLVCDPQGRLVLANRAARLFGERNGLIHFDSMEALLQRLALFDEDGVEVPLTERPLAAALAGRETTDRVVGVEAPQGRAWLRISARPLRESGDELLGAFTIFRDISEARAADARVARLNAELEGRVAARTAALAATNRELEAFSYAVSHDLREPLRALEGFSLALLEDYGERLEGDGELYVRRIRAATERLNARIDALLKLSRVTRGPLNREVVDLGALAERILESLQTKDPERVVEATIGGDLEAEADPALAAIVIENLVDNAWKFSRGRSPAHIEVGRTDAGFFVRDDGAGFPQSFAEKVFGAFTRYHTEREFEGTGIGLTTVKRIVHRHGGQVWVESSEGEGTTVFFTWGGDPA